MAGESRAAVLLKEVRTLFGLGVVGGLTDGELLDQFLTSDGVAAERAFGVLVERHGPMVLHVCRHALDDPHEAEDAFQATFLVFLRRARSIRNRDSVASWLFGVALRVARRTRYAAVIRRFHERQCGILIASRRTVPSGTSDCRAALHEEIARLPGRYREPIVLCHLEGLSTAAVAERLGCAHGTILSRLSRARERLRRRLVARGMTVPIGLFAANLAPHEAAGALAAASANSLPTVAGRAAFAATASPAVSALTQATLRSLFMTRLSLAAAVVATATALAALTIPFVRPIFAIDEAASLLGQGSQPSEGKPRLNVQEPVQSPDLEETFYKVLKRNHEFNHPHWPFLVKVRDVQDRTLIDATLKHRVAGKDDFDLVIQARRAVFRFDLGAKVVRVDLDEAEIQPFVRDPDVILINNRLLEFPIPPDTRFPTEQTLPGPTTSSRGKAVMTDSERARSLGYSPDGKTVATAGFDGVVHLWDMVMFEEAGRLNGEKATIRSLSLETVP